jgi:HK97 family phage prohead protease
MSFSDIEFKASSGTFNIDQAQGIVECFVAGVGNKDSVGDVLLPGAFNGSLRRRKPRVVWGHNWNDPIGKVLEIYEVPPSDPRLPMKMKSAGIGGLYARVQFNLNSEKGKEAFANVAFFGEEQEWSIGYKTIQASFDPNLQANILKEVELYEVSPVLHGANQLTGTISVKSDTAVLDESKGHGMPGMPGMPGMMPSPGMPSGMMKPMAPKPQQVVKPVRPSIPESPLMVALRRELVKRSGSNVIVRTVTENIVIFDRLTSDGQSSTYRVSYNFQDGEFMFGKPERVQAQTVYSPADTERVTPMENFNVSIKPQADAYMGDDPEEFIAMPGKSEDFDFDGFDFDDLEAKVGRALNNRNLSKLKTVMEMLQDIVASAEKEKEVEVKEYLIAVDVKDAFHTKQLLDPIMDYHRVDSYVSEKGIVVTSGVTPEFIEAVETLKKGIGNRIGRGGGGGKGRRLARGAASFDPKAWDGDGDGLVQEGTPFQRPAIPGVNDQASRGRGLASRREPSIPSGRFGRNPQDMPVLNPKKATRAELERNARQAFSMLDDAEKARGKEKPKAPLNPNLPQDRLRGMASSTSGDDKKKEIWDKIKGISLRQPKNASDEKPPSLATEGKKNRISKKLQQWATRQAYEASQYSPYFIDTIAKENNLDPNGVEMRTWASINRYDKLNNAMKILYARRQDFIDAKKENGSLTPSQEKELKTLNKTINSFSRSHQNAVRDITENLPEDISKDILDEVASPNNINNKDWPKPGQSMRGLASRTSREADHWEFFSDTTQEDRARAFFNITEGRSENLVGDKMLDAVRSNEKLLDDIVESAEGLRKFYQDDLEFDLENSKEVLDILNLKDKTKMKQKLTELANGTEKDSDILAGLLEQYGVASNEKYEGVTSKAGLEKVFDDEVFDFLNEYTFDNGPESWRPEPVKAKERGRGLASSTSVVPKREVLKGEIVSGPGSTPVSDKFIDRSGIPDKHADILKNIISNLDEDDEMLSETRKNFLDAIKNGDFDDYLKLQSSERNFDRYISDDVGMALTDAVRGMLAERMMPKNASKKQEDKINELIEEMVDEWSDSLFKTARRISANKPPTDKQIQDAKKESSQKKRDLIQVLQSGELDMDEQDFEQDFWFEVGDILELDPSIDLEDFSKELQKAIQKGFEENPKNSQINSLWENYFKNGLNQGVMDELEDTRLNSEFLQERVRAKRTLTGGLRSSTPQSADFDSSIPKRSEGSDGLENLDSDVLNYRMQGNSLAETAKRFKMTEQQVRQREIAETRRLREAGSDKDILAYRLNGLSLDDTAKLFGTTPQKIRQREAKEMARMRKEGSDMDISDYRMRGVSLDDMAELMGTTRQNIRKREMRPAPPDSPTTDEQMAQMAKDRGMRSPTGNPRPVSMTLSNDEIGELRDEVTLLKKYSANNAALDSFDEKLKNSKNGKIDLTSEEIKDIEEAVGSAMNNADGKIVTSDIDGVLGQTIESPDGKYVSPNWEEQQAGGRGNLGMRSKTPNNGAPPQIDEARQKKLIFFMNSADGGRLGVSRRIREQYAERGDGTMPARDWKALNTLYGNRTGDKLPIETERFRDGREDGGGLRSSTEESVGRDRSAGMSVSGLGEVGKERGTRGRSLGGGEDVSIGAKRYSGKKFNDVKPDNWDDMSNDDKFEWLFSNSPERSGMSSVEYDREIQKLLKEEGLLEDRRSRKERIAESAASGEKPESGSVAKQGEAKPKGVKVTPRPDNEKDAAKQRKDDYSLLEKAIDKQIGDVTKLNDKDRISQMHVDAWDEIGEIMDSDDLSRNQIKATIQRLKNYLEDAYEADEAEGSAEKIVEAARKLLKTMQVMDTYYGKDKFIVDGPEINIIPRTGVAGQQLADVSDDAFDVDSVGGMRSRVPVNASKVVSSSVKDYVASRSSRNSGLRSSTGRAGRTEIKEEATFFKDILDSLPKEISEAKKNNDRKTSQALEKLSQIINRQEAAKLGDKRTNAGRILMTRDEVDEVLDAVMMVIDRQGAKGGGARQEKFAKFIDMLAKAAMATFIDRSVEELGARTTARQTSRGRSVEIQDL